MGGCGYVCVLCLRILKYVGFFQQLLWCALDCKIISADMLTHTHTQARNILVVSLGGDATLNPSNANLKTLKLQDNDSLRDYLVPDERYNASGEGLPTFTITQTHTHTHKHALTHTFTHTHTYTYKHAHTNTYACPFCLASFQAV